MNVPEAPRDATGVEGQWVAIAHIQRPQGRRGEVSADLLTDFPERFIPGLQVMACVGAQRRALLLESAWVHKGRMILKFAGVDTITEAETLRDALIQVPASERVPLPAGQVYVSDLMGCAVLEQDEEVGTVVGWEETGAVPLLRVDGTEGELLIPFTPEICYSVDIASKQVWVRMPQGLRELRSASEGKSRGRQGR